MDKYFPWFFGAFVGLIVFGFVVSYIHRHEAELNKKLAIIETKVTCLQSKVTFLIHEIRKNK